MAVIECCLDTEETISSVLLKICYLYGKDSSDKHTAIIAPRSSHFYLPDVIEQVLLLHSLALFRPLSCRPTKFVLVTSLREYVTKLALCRAGQRSFFDNPSATLNTPDVYTLASLKVQIQSTVLCTRCSSAFLKNARNSQRQYVEVHCLGSKAIFHLFLNPHALHRRNRCSSF